MAAPLTTRSHPAHLTGSAGECTQAGAGMRSATGAWRAAADDTQDAARTRPSQKRTLTAVHVRRSCHHPRAASICSCSAFSSGGDSISTYGRVPGALWLRLAGFTGAVPCASPSAEVASILSRGSTSLGCDGDPGERGDVLRRAATSEGSARVALRSADQVQAGHRSSPAASPHLRRSAKNPT